MPKADIRILSNIFATRPSGVIEKRVSRLEDLLSKRDLIEAKLNARMRNRERTGSADLGRKEIEAANKEVLERTSVFKLIDDEVERTRGAISSEEGGFCHWVGDKALRIEDVEFGWYGALEDFRDYARGGYGAVLDEESCAELFDNSKRLVRELTEIKAMLRRAVITSRALEMEIPDEVMNALDSDPERFGELKRALFSEMYADAVITLGEHSEEAIVELLKMFYPKSWEELSIQMDPASWEKHIGAAECRRWKEELGKKHPSAYLTMRDIDMLIEFSNGDMGKSERFVELVEKGVLPSDAGFLVFHNSSEKQRAFHLSIDLRLCMEGLRHADIFHATNHLAEDNLKELANNLNAYAKWMRAMPKEMPDPARQVISALLAIHSGTPQKRKDVLELLARDSSKVLAELQRSNPTYVSEFAAYFMASSSPEAKKGGEISLCTAPPYASLVFSNDMEYYIGLDNISATDIKLAIAYALKASEGNARCGGTYISTAAFRDMLEKVLPINDVSNVLPYRLQGPKVRAERVELQLSSHGVVVYKRNGQLIGINLDENGKRRSEREPTERGAELLRITRQWMLDIDRGAAWPPIRASRAPPPQDISPSGAKNIAPPAAETGIFDVVRAAVRRYAGDIASRISQGGDTGKP